MISWVIIEDVCAEKPSSIDEYSLEGSSFKIKFLMYTLFPVPVGPQNNSDN
jgi:hypothetical protein